MTGAQRRRVATTELKSTLGVASHRQRLLWIVTIAWSVALFAMTFWWRDDRLHRGDTQFLHRSSITALMPRLDPKRFVRIHRSAIVNLDLQGMRYVEMPWFVQPDHPAVMVYPVPRAMSVDEERLYAFGIDAYRISQQLLRGDKRAPIDGVTGRLTLEPPTHFARSLTPAEVDGGRAIPLRAP